MNKRRKQKIIKNVVITILLLFMVIIVSILVHLYVNYLDEKTNEHLEKSNVTFISKGNDLNNNGLYVANIKDDLSKYLENKDVLNVTYKFENEDFYIEFEVIKNEDGSLSFNVDKIVNEYLNINARLNLVNVSSVEYRSSIGSDEALIKIKSLYDTDFFAMTNSAYHLLGDDIEEISYMDEHFYYMSYNPKYRALETAESCSKEVKKDIKNFSTKDYYYKYGRINFLTDYYQKLSSKTYTVGDKCDELKALLDAAQID